MASILDTPSGVATATHTFSVSAGTNRILIVGVQTEGTQSGAMTCDYGGQAMTNIIQELAGSATTQQTVALFWLNDTGISAASNTTITASNVGSVDVSVHAASYQDCLQTTPTTYDSDTTAAATPNPMAALDITTSGTDSIVCAFGGMGNAGTSAWAAPLTERTDVAPSSSTGSFADGVIATAQTVACEVTFTTQNRACAVALELEDQPTATTFYTQFSFRGRNDDGSETTATWKAATNTNWNQPQATPFRLRLLIQETLDVAEADVSFQLQYSHNSGTWTDVTGASSIVQSVASGNITDGGNTTQQIGSGTFVTPNAGIDEVDGIAGGASLDFTTTVDQEVELEYSLQILSAGTARGDTIQFRVQKDGSNIGLYMNTPTVTIPVGAGMTMASADLLVGAGGVQNPGTFNFQRGIDWGAITLALRPKVGGSSSALAPTAQFNTFDNSTTVSVTVQDGGTVDGILFEGNLNLLDVIDMDLVVVEGALDFGAAGTYDLTDCDINEVTNSSGGAVIINASDTVITTNTGPNITINNSVTVAVLVKDTSGANVSGARVYLETSPGGVEIVNDVTTATGIVSTLYNFLSDQAIVGRVRKSTGSPLYQTFDISGTITSTGFEVTAIMVLDE